MPPAKRNSDESLSPLSTNDGLARPSIKTSASACNPQVSAVASALTLCGDGRPKTAAIDGSETLEQHESQQRSQAATAGSLAHKSGPQRADLIR